jgi:hypothetical protein
MVEMSGKYPEKFFIVTILFFALELVGSSKSLIVDVGREEQQNTAKQFTFVVNKSRPKVWEDILL